MIIIVLVNALARVLLAESTLGICLFVVILGKLEYTKIIYWYI